MNGNAVLATGQRIWEIDIARGCAVLLMILFHFVYDLSRFGSAAINVNSPIWQFTGKAAAFLFISLAGLSTTLSKDPVRRGMRVLASGMLITIVTYFTIRPDYVRFGILHFLGLAMLSSPVWHRCSNRTIMLIAGGAAVAGLVVSWISVNVAWLLPLGIRYPGFTTVDYYPVFPYLALFLTGLVIGRKYYATGHSRWPGTAPVFPLLGTMGRHSLPIYLLHQPLLIGLIKMAGFLKV